MYNKSLERNIWPCGSNISQLSRYPCDRMSVGIQNSQERTISHQAPFISLSLGLLNPGLSRMGGRLQGLTRVYWWQHQRAKTSCGQQFWLKSCSHHFSPRENTELKWAQLFPHWSYIGTSFSSRTVIWGAPPKKGRFNPTQDFFPVVHFIPRERVLKPGACS